MKSKVSIVFLGLLSVVMLGVVFGILTDSRNSILVKEMFYVAGGSIASVLAGILLLTGKPFYKNRIPVVSLSAVTAVLLLMLVMHFAGSGSVNGPFTFLMLLSLAALTVSSLLFIDESHVRLFVSFTLGASAVVFFYAILQWQGVNIFAWDAALTRSGRSTGSLGNPNLLGGYASAMIPLSIAYFASLKKLSSTVKFALAFVFASLAACAVIASGTRGSVIGVVAGCGLLLFWYMKNASGSIKKSLPFAVLFMVIVVTVTIPMSSRFSELNSDAEDQGTLQVRKTIWSGSLRLISDSPFTGHGPGSFQILFPEYRDPRYSILGVSHNTLHAHCEYLEILVDIGILGLILWGIAACSVAKKTRGAGMIQAGAFAGMAAMLAEAVVSVHLRWPPTAWLFASLVMVFLSKKTEQVVPAGRNRAGGAILILTGSVLVLGFFTHYIPMSQSSRLVFKGKDVFLTRTESYMSNAYSAASQWANSGNEAALSAAVMNWQNASACADSAVVYSRQATEIYPKDLGSWYALGSSHLTRYMIMMPPVTVMRSALEAAGLSPQFTDQDLHEELLSGMLAYDSLVSMAPNYAEVHNNLALGYSNLGMIDESMEELYKSYRIHAHRRQDYFNQVSSLLMIYPDSHDGALLILNHVLNGFDTEATVLRLEKCYDALKENLWYITNTQPENAEIIKEEFLALSEEILTSEQYEAVSVIVADNDSYSPSGFWETGQIFSMSGGEAISELESFFIISCFYGKIFPSVLSSDPGLYTYAARVLFDSDWNNEIFDSVLNIYLRQICMDRNIDDAFTLMQNERFSNSVQPDVALNISRVRLCTGGSRAAMRSGLQMPWMPGSLPSILSDSLHSRMSSDSLNSEWYEAELHMNFILISSFWWDYNIYASSQNQYLLDRIFYCRDMIKELKPSSWQQTVSFILSEEIERMSPFTGGVCPATIIVLADDLVSGVGRDAN